MIMLAPLIEKEKRIKGVTYTYSVPIYEEYERIHREKLTPSTDPLDKEERRLETQRIDAVKAAIFGPDLKLNSPDRYQEVGMLREEGLLATWDQFDLSRQAEIIAEYRLSQMVEVYRRLLEHEESQKKSKKK